jgi:hypothetical protein
MIEPENHRKNESKKDIKINCPEEIAQGKYSNLFITTISSEELIVDFALLYPHSNQAKVQSRIILTPGNAKKLKSMLEKNLLEYEKFKEKGSDFSGPDVKFSIN